MTDREPSTELAQRLTNSLMKVDDLSRFMSHQGVPVGFAEDDTFYSDPVGSVFQVSDIWYEEIGVVDGYQIIIYRTLGGDRGYAKLDTEHMVCRPIAVYGFRFLMRGKSAREIRAFYTGVGTALERLDNKMVA